MNPSEAERRFVQLIADVGHTTSTLTPAVGVPLMLDFFRCQRPRGCSTTDGADMLLYQWGCYDWGEGEFFEVDITRQFAVAAREDDDILQLSLTFRYVPDTAKREWRESNRWCEAPGDLTSFRAYILASPPWQALANKRPAKVRLNFGSAG